MTPSLWVGFLFVLLVLVAGGAEVYAYRRRGNDLRDRFRSEYTSSLRDYERLRRAQQILDARQQRAERRLVALAPVPVVQQDTAPDLPLMAESTHPDSLVGD
jgi:hypothetical protein